MQVAALSLQNRQKAELQLKAEKQTAHELAQMQDTLNREEMLWTNAHHSTVVTEALTAGPNKQHTLNIFHVSDWPASVIA